MAPIEKTADSAAVAKIALGSLLAIGLVRTVALLLTNGISLLGLTLAGSQRPLTYTISGTKIWIVVVDVLTVLLVIKLMAREDTSPIPLLDPRPIGKTLLMTMGTVIIVYFGFGVGFFAGNLLIYYGVPPVTITVAPQVWVGLIRLIIVPITVAIAEEALFRGYLLPRFQVHFGRVGAVIVTSILAATQYLAFNMGNLDAVLAGAIGYFVVNLCFGATYLWFKRLTPLIFAHWFFEAIAGFAILKAALYG